jgi:hypothetical protein
MAAKVFSPTLAHVGGVERAGFAQTRFGQQRFRPVPQRSTQSLAERDPEAIFERSMSSGGA